MSQAQLTQNVRVQCNMSLPYQVNDCKQVGKAHPMAECTQPNLTDAPTSSRISNRCDRSVNCVCRAVAGPHYTTTPSLSHYKRAVCRQRDQSGNKISLYLIQEQVQRNCTWAGFIHTP